MKPGLARLRSRRATPGRGGEYPGNSPPDRVGTLGERHGRSSVAILAIEHQIPHRACNLK